MWGRKVWKSVDAAIREAVPMDAGAPAIDYSRDRVDGSSEAGALAAGARAVVLAALSRFSEQEQQLLVYYAHFKPISEIAKRLRIRKARAAQIHHRARAALCDRLVKAEVLADGP